MYADRTPTNRELLAEVMGYVAVIAGAVMLSFAAAFVFWSSMSFVWLQLTPVSTALLMVGWEVQITPPRQSFHYPPVLTMIVVCILCAVIGGAYGFYFIGFIGLTSAIFVVPVSTITTFGSWRTWRNSEGSTRGKRSLEPVVLSSGVIRPQEGNYGQKFRAAEEMFDNARFNNAVSYLRAAQRAPVEWHFDREGASPDTLSLLRDSLHCQPRREWDIFVVMVSALPEERQQPAVIVVMGADLDKMVVDDDAITLQTEGYSAKISGSLMRGIVCYSW